jgi:hypothetical protein
MTDSRTGVNESCMDSSKKTHPIWDLYDEFRTARLNVKCLQAEIRDWTRASNISEILIALSSTASIGGFWFFQNWVGGYVWKTIGAAAVVCTILKRVFRVQDALRFREGLLVEYKILDHDFHDLVIQVSQKRSYTPYLQQEFAKLRKRKRELERHAKGFDPSRNLIGRCQELVETELPSDKFFIPD